MSIQEVMLLGCSNHIPSMQARKELQSVLSVFEMINLDTPNDRKRVINGNIVAVNSVPTLLVITTSNVIERYVGLSKIREWIEYNKQPVEEIFSYPVEDHTGVVDTSPQQPQKPQTPKVLSVMEMAKQMSEEANSKWEPPKNKLPPQ